MKAGYYWVKLKPHACHNTRSKICIAYHTRGESHYFIKGSLLLNVDEDNVVYGPRISDLYVEARKK